jgi:hypothetical protein
MTMPSSPSPNVFPAEGRPVLITILCVISAIGLTFTIPLIFSAGARAIAAWYPPFLAIATIVGAICTVGFWLMKKWSVYLYAAMFVINQVVMMAMGVWTIPALLIPAIVIGIAFIYLPQMR